LQYITIEEEGASVNLMASYMNWPFRPQKYLLLLIILFSLALNILAVDQKLINFAQNIETSDAMVLADPQPSKKSTQVKGSPKLKGSPTKKSKSKISKKKKPTTPTSKPKKPKSKLKSSKKTKKGMTKNKKLSKKQKKSKLNGKKGKQSNKNQSKGKKVGDKSKVKKIAGKNLKKPAIRKVRYYHKPTAKMVQYLKNLTLIEEKKHALLVRNLTTTQKKLQQVESRVDQLGMRKFRITMRKQVHKLLDKLQYKGNVKIMIRRDPPKDPLDFRGEMRNAEDRSPIHHKMNFIMSKGNIPLKKAIHSLESKVSKKSATLKDRFSGLWKTKPKKPESAKTVSATSVKGLTLAPSSPLKPRKHRLRGRRVHRRYRKGRSPKFYEIDQPDILKPTKKILRKSKGVSKSPQVSSKPIPKSSLHPKTNTTAKNTKADPSLTKS
jgi:hypothetical protein